MHPCQTTLQRVAIITVEQASVRCLAPYGRLLEIGKYDVLGGGTLPMQPLDRNIAFEGIDLDRLFFDGADADQARPA